MCVTHFTSYRTQKYPGNLCTGFYPQKEKNCNFPRTKPFDVVMLSTTQLGPRVLVWLRFACQCCASMLRVVLSAHEVIMPHGHQGQPGVTPRHPLVGGLTPHTGHHYSFEPFGPRLSDSSSPIQDSSQDSDSCALARGLRSTFVHRSVSPERGSARGAWPPSLSPFLRTLSYSFV